jgi:hypothetical protein
MAGQAGLTTEQYIETIKKTDGLLTGLAGSAQRGAEAFSLVQKKVIESDAGDALNAIGISSKELADFTALSLANNTRLNLKSVEGQTQAAAAAAEMAYQLDETSKITGQSREALLNTLKAEEKKPNVILMEMQMSKEQREGYEKLKVQMAGFGPSFQTLSAEIASGGVRTKEGLAQMAALGPAGVQFEKATRMMTNAQTAGEKAAAQSALDQAQAAINQRMASKEYNDMMQYGTAEQKAAISNQVSGYQGLSAAQKAAQDANGDYVKALANQKLEARTVQGGAKVGADGKPILDKDGKQVMDEGQQTARMLNEVNRQAVIQAGGMAQNFEKLNGKIGASETALEAFNKTLGFIGKSATMDESARSQRNAPADAAAKVFGRNQAEPSDTSKLGNTTHLPDVAAHGDGGIIRGPELAVIAEKGPEAVVPLNQLKSVMGDVGATVSDATGGSKQKTLADATNTFGKSLGSLTQEIQNGGIKTKESISQMALLGPAGRQYVDAVNAMKDAKTAEQKTMAQVQIAKAEDAIKDRISSKDFHDIMEISNKDQQEQGRKLVESMNFTSTGLKDSTKSLPKAKDFHDIMEISNKDQQEQGRKLVESMNFTSTRLKDSTKSLPKAEDLTKAIPKIDIKPIEVKPDSAKEVLSSFNKSVGDIFHPKIINSNPKDFKEAPKTTEIATSKVEADRKKNEEVNAVKSEAEHKEKLKTNEANAQIPVSTTVKDATLNDLKEQLIQLNKNMTQLIGHSETAADAANKTAKGITRSSGSRFGPV